MASQRAETARRVAESAYPGWLDRERYPFDTYRLGLPEGRVHYVDEGEGRPVVFLHGNPTWSYLYRHLVRGLADDYRCIAPDLLGFGLSENPEGFSYRPADHARVVERLLESLDVDDAAVVGHDWGGPLGLDYATRNPGAVAGVVASNTWMWPRRRLLPRLVSYAFGNPLGKRAVLRFNAFARSAVGPPYLAGMGIDRASYRHYTAPLSSPGERRGSWAFTRALRDPTGWLDRLWDRRGAVAGTPALLLWGMRDPVQGPLLPRWQALFPAATEVVYDDAGHFVPEAVGADLVGPVRAFLEDL